MKLDAFATFPHYIDHMAPVWRALKPAQRGSFYTTPELLDQAKSLGIEATVEAVVRDTPAPILVAASGNAQRVLGYGRTNIAIMEHGSGQSYGGSTSPLDMVAFDSHSYAGGLNRPAGLFLHPGEHPAARERWRYPDRRVEVIGSPRLDTLPARVPGGGPTVAFSFHFDANVSPEARSTFIMYREQLAMLAKEARGEFTILGHGHPRIIDRLTPWYKAHDIEVVRNFDDVCRRADVYVMDGVSTLYEFASTGRPVVVMNGSFYRPHIEHGLRFWSAANVGQNVWEPYDIGKAVRAALARPDRDQEAREAALDLVYAYRTGAAERAAAILADWASRLGKSRVAA